MGTAGSAAAGGGVAGGGGGGGGGGIASAAVSSVSPPPPMRTVCQVQCAGCRRILNVPSGVVNFQCPKCKLAQIVPPLHHQQQQQQQQQQSGGMQKLQQQKLGGLGGGGGGGGGGGSGGGGQMVARGIDSSKIQLPCANCRAVLNVPPGLTRFVCPQCRVELAVDPLKLAAYMSSLSQFSVASNNAHISGFGVSEAAEPPPSWTHYPLAGGGGGGSAFPIDEVNEVRAFFFVIFVFRV